MMKKLLLILAISMSFTLSNMAQVQPLQVYTTDSNTVVTEWSKYIDSVSLPKGQAYQGTINYAIPAGAWWAGGLLSLNKYNYWMAADHLLDVSMYTHFQFTVHKQMNRGSSLGLRLEDSLGAKSSTILIKTASASDTTYTISLQKIGGINPTILLDMLFDINPPWNVDPNLSGSDTGIFQLSNIQFVDLLNVKQGTSSIAKSGTFDFGSSPVGTPVTKIFTIENLGDTIMDLVGSPDLIYDNGGANPGDFTIDYSSTASSIPAGGSTTFKVTYNGTASGTRTTQIAIENSYSADGIFLINLTGNDNVTALQNKYTLTDIQVSPNPSTGIFTINSSEKVDAVTVTDYLGKVVSNSSDLKIDLSNNPDGLYFVTITSGEKSAVKKLIKK